MEKRRGRKILWVAGRKEREAFRKQGKADGGKLKAEHMQDRREVGVVGAKKTSAD